VQDIARRNGAVFVADEVQSGIGRTGTMFASEYEGIEPDLVCTAKALGGGLPLAAVTGRAELMDAVQPGGLGGTYAGNPLACAAALGVLEMFEDGSLLERALEIERVVRSRLVPLAAELPAIAEVRGRGAMLAIEFVQPGTLEPAPEIARAVAARCHSQGVVILVCGSYGNVIRLLPPLVIPQDLLQDGLDVLVEAIASCLLSATIVPLHNVSRDPRTGATQEGPAATSSARGDALVAAAASAAEVVAGSSPSERERWLVDLADFLELAADELVALADAETALGPGRLRGELSKTAAQARFYGAVAAEGSWLSARLDQVAGPPPMDLRRANLPVGPVAVFGASNFPFCFGVAGHDTLSALAAGCPVLVKAHPAHPRLSVRLGQVVAASLVESGAPAGAFGLVVGFDAGLASWTRPRFEQWLSPAHRLLVWRWFSGRASGPNRSRSTRRWARSTRSS
jgi:hypothetical protein